jgi:hypothetical protein
MRTLLLVKIASLLNCISHIVVALWMSYASKSLLSCWPGVPV